MAKPNAKKDLDLLRQAAAAYAQATAVAFPAKTEASEDREAALAKGADVYDAIAALCVGDKEAKGRELYVSIARQYREELLRLYKSSSFRAEVEQKLGAAEGQKP
jgi:hypothetical protein